MEKSTSTIATQHIHLIVCHQDKIIPRIERNCNLNEKKNDNNKINRISIRAL